MLGPVFTWADCLSDVAREIWVITVKTECARSRQRVDDSRATTQQERGEATRKPVPGDYGGRDMQRREGTSFTRKYLSLKVKNYEYGDALSCFQRRTIGIALLLWAKVAHGHVRIELAAPEVQREAAELR
jgi:hypothetical protein